MLALLCGGQGRISAEMFDLAADEPEAAPVFAAAATLLGEDPRALVKQAPADSLLANRANQLLSVCAALANHACIRVALPSRLAVTGYSVGEMAAWSLAGIWSPQQTLQLTAARAEAMDAADGGGGQLGYVRGLDRAAIDGLAQVHGCAIAIICPGDLYVIGGAHDDVAACCAVAARDGAQRAALLDVRIASHTPRLAAAVPLFQAALDQADGARPRNGRVLLAGCDGSRIFSSDQATARLAAQIAAPIDWAASLEALVELGVDQVLDLGPGHALADMMRAAHPHLRSYAADGFRSGAGLRNWLVSL